MKELILVCAGPLSALLAFVTNWLALVPWRRAKGAHWSERARLYFPVRVAAASNLWVIPAVVTMSSALVWPEESPNWILLVLVTGLGTALGSLVVDFEVFPHVPRAELLRQAARTWLVRFSQWFVFLVAIALTEDRFSVQTFLILAGVTALCIFWSRDGWIHAAKTLGLFTSPPERLLIIVREVAARANVPVRDIYLMRSHIAQAYAMPSRRRLLFSQRLLELLSDEELAAITAHELAHLTEARSDYYKRYIIWLTFLPWVLFKPMVHVFGSMGFLMLLGLSVGVPFAYRGISRQLETRADQMAHTNEPEPGTYARALLKLHQDALLPAVHARRQATHPHLYDRLLAAGLQPDFPRPAPSKPTAWNGYIFSAALGGLAMFHVMRLTAHF